MKGITVALACLALLVAASCTAEVFGPIDYDTIYQMVSQPSADGTDLPTRLRETHSALATLRLLERVPSEEVVVLYCRMAQTQLAQDGLTAEQLFHAVGVAGDVRCLGEAAAADAAAAAAAAKPGSTEDAYFSTATLAGLHQLGLMAKVPSLAHLEAFAAALPGQLDKAGLIKPSPDAKSGTVAGTGQAALLVADLKRLGAAVDKPARSLLDTLPKVLGKAASGGLGAAGDVDKLAAAALFLRGAAALEASALDVHQLKRVAEFLLACKEVGTPSDAYAVVAGLKALSGHRSKLPIPLFAYPLTTALPAVGAGELKVVVTDVLARPAPAARVTLLSATRVGHSGPFLTDEQLEASHDNPAHVVVAYTLDFLDEGPDLGVYTLEFEAEASDKDWAGAAGRSAVQLAVTDAATAADLEVRVQDAESGELRSTHTPSYPTSLGDPLKLSGSQQVEVTFKVHSEYLAKRHGGSGAFVPQQAVLQVASAETGASAQFAAKPVKAVGGEASGALSATVSVASIAKQLGLEGGKFELTLLVGDAGLAAPIKWHLTTLKISSAALANTHVATQAAQQGPPPAFQVLPEIVHQFRKPEKRPAAVVSLLFAALVWLPLAGLILVLGRLKVNTKGFPSGASFIPAVAFHGGILAMLLLYVAFWVKLNLMQTVPILALLGLFTAVAGYYNLSNLAEARLKKQ